MSEEAKAFSLCSSLVVVVGERKLGIFHSLFVCLFCVFFFPGVSLCLFSEETCTCKILKKRSLKERFLLMEIIIPALFELATTLLPGLISLILLSRGPKVGDPAHADAMTAQEREQFPRPSFLPSNGIFIAVCGVSGNGKSSLNNALRGVRNNTPGASPVGATETTMTPMLYPFPGRPEAQVCDLPGGATVNFPASEYIRRFGLRFFAAVVIVVGDRLTELDANIVAHMEEYRVPYYIVRSKMDVAMENESSDNGLTQEQTFAKIRAYVTGSLLQRPTSASASRVYLVSVRRQEIGEWGSFVRDLTADLGRSYTI